MARDNRYNRYSQPYLPAQSGGNSVYQPVHDPNDTERWANLLNQRQGRYDVGRAKFADFQGTAGSADTYVPDLLEERLQGFSGSVKEMVDTQYNGDWGLAANDVTDMIADEKANPFYKYMNEQNKQEDLRKQFKAKNRDTYFDYYGTDQLSQADRFNQAFQNKDMSAFETQYGTRPEDREQIAASLVNRVKPDVWQKNFSELSDTEKESIESVLGAGSADAIFKNIKTSSNESKIDKLKSNFVEALLKKDTSLIKEFGEEGARKYAEDMINTVSPMFKQLSQTSTVTNLTPKATTTGATNPLIIPGRQSANSNQYEKSVEQFGVKENQINLSQYKPIENIDKELANAKKSFSDAKTTISQSKVLENTEEYNKKLVAQKDFWKNRIADLEKNQEGAKAMKLITDFEDNFGKMTKVNEFGELVEVTDPNEKAWMAANINDKMQNSSSGYINTGNKAMDDALNETFVNAVKFNSVYVPDGKDEAGNEKFRKEEKGDFEITKNNFWRDKNYNTKEEREDFKFAGINPITARVVMENSDGEQVEYSNSVNSKEIGLGNKKMLKNLKNKGYSLDSHLGASTFTIQTYDPYRDGGVVANVSIPITDENKHFLDGVTDRKSALQAYEKMSSVSNLYPTETLIQNAVFGKSKDYGFTNKSNLPTK